MSESSIKTATLHVWRGAPDEAGHYDDFEVPYEDGMSVLDAPEGVIKLPASTERARLFPHELLQLGLKRNRRYGSSRICITRRG